MEELDLIQQGYYQLKVGAYASAAELFEKALLWGDDPDAHVGLLLAENGLDEESKLPSLPRPLASYLHFEKALACGSDAVKRKLQQFKEEQATVFEKKKKDLQTLENAKNEEKTKQRLIELIALAKELKDFENANELRAAFEEELRTIEEGEKKKNKRKLLILAPLLAAVVIAAVVCVLVFALPKIDGVRYALTLNGFEAISCDDDLETVILPDEVRGVKVVAVGNKAFKNCRELRSVTLGAHVRKIGKAAFSGCVNLKTVNGSERVRFVLDNAFKGCADLKKIVLAPDCEIAPGAFKDCDNGLEVLVGDRRFVPGVEDDAAERAALLPIGEKRKETRFLAA